jgi:hypothetical protein
MILLSFRDVSNLIEFYEERIARMNRLMSISLTSLAAAFMAK